MIKIRPFDAVYPGDNPFGRPDMQAALMLHYGVEHYRACQLVRESGRGGLPMLAVLVVTMQQSIELLVKSIALRKVPGFVPKRYGHDIRKVVEENAGAVPVFATLLASRENVELLDQLRNGYLAVRYGESHVDYDDAPTWQIFCRVVQELLAVAQAN